MIASRTVVLFVSLHVPVFRTGQEVHRLGRIVERWKCRSIGRSLGENVSSVFVYNLVCFVTLRILLVDEEWLDAMSLFLFP